ncbi:hypothetical protein Mmar10_1314 [Maricaulis maris MCS10]|uniref:Uncharacterized protein n=1 Tax=Maricaulis maris (strain MCS10) TaxID=394221 RepID=Q0AQ31_MARMM|nr:hypothetical protein [Maricaulis maris]ABI65606.1 hypothetical protein Mmar10_1314 [Maricaulis maris MCS10]
MKRLLRIVWQGLLPVWGLLVLCALAGQWLYFEVLWQPNFSFERRADELGQVMSPSGLLSLRARTVTNGIVRDGETSWSDPVSVLTLVADDTEHPVAYMSVAANDELLPLEQDERLDIAWLDEDRAIVTYCGVRLGSMINAITLRTDPESISSPVRLNVEIEFNRRDGCELAPPPGLMYPGRSGDAILYGQTGTTSSEEDE